MAQAGRWQVKNFLTVFVIGFRVLMYAGGLVSAVVYLLNAGQVKDLRTRGRDNKDAPEAVVATEGAS